MEKKENVKREASYGGSYDTGDGLKLKIPYSFFGSIIGQEELDAIKEVLKGETFTMGPQVTKFQEEFAKYCGTKYAFATSSGTTALHIAIQLLGLKPGDEVITTPITFIATSLPMLKPGAVPVFADIDSRTINIDPKSIEKNITSKTKAIVVVHYGSQMCDMDPIMELAKKHNLLVVEDAAHTPGAEYKGRKAGSIGDVACFSFHPLKNMTTFEGGMITTNNDKFAKQIPILRCISLTDYENQKDYWLPYHYDVISINGELGNNYRMDEVRAAVGRVQLRKLDKHNAMRRERTKYINEKLKDVEGIQIPYEDPNCTQVCYLYSPRYQPHVVGAPKDEFIRVLYYEEGIQPILHYLPNYLFKIYQDRGYKRGLCPVAEDVFFNQIMTLPMHPRFTYEELDIMANGIKSAIEKVRKR